MKKTPFILLAVALLSLTKVNAQEAPKKNVVKVNLLPLTTGTYAVEYERSILPKLSIGVMGSLRPKDSKLPFYSSWESFVGSEDEDLQHALKNTTQGATSLALEARFYPSKKGIMKGFYLAPYAKYAQYDVSLPFQVDLDFSEDGSAAINEVNTSGSLKAITAGLGLGVQFNLGKSVVLDWRIVAPGFGSANGDLSGKADRLLTPAEQDELREQLDELDDIKFIESKTVDANGINITAKGPWAGIRTALSIGYRF